MNPSSFPTSGRGRGAGDALVRAALAYARELGFHVMTRCPYVQVWMQKHPDERPRAELRRLR
jgi:predicted GNAT family acetyltransferase